MKNPILEDYISRMPGDDGWRKSSTEKVFLEAANYMYPRLSTEEIKTILEEIYFAMKDEYGD